MDKIKIFKNKTFVALLIVILLSLGALRGLVQRGYFPMHDDLQVMRLFEMEKCLKDGQIPCRWVSDMGYGYGFPLFNFYPPGPYYLGIFIKFLLNLSFLDTVKILFGLSFILSGVFMFFLASSFWGEIGGIVSAILFIYAPYHSADIYVRGAMNEVFGLTFFPLIFLSLFNLVRKSDIYWLILSAISIFCLFLSHSLMAMIFMPLAGIWFLFWVVKLKKLKPLLSGTIAVILSIGFSSFFLIPAIFEQSLVQIQNLTSDYFFYGSHFVSSFQLLISRIWGYGPSEYGSNDRFSFQIGWPHWWLVVFVLILLVYSLIRKRKTDKKLMTFFLIIGFLFSAFMVHAKSIQIWQAITPLKFVQFPWRFLSLTIFFNAFLGGFIIDWFKRSSIKKIIAIIIVTSAIVFNISYFDFQTHYLNSTDQEKLTGELFRIQKQAGLLDYLPLTVKTPPKSEAPDKPRIISGQANVRYFNKKSDYWSSGFEVLGTTPAEIEIPVFEFPYWQVTNNNKPISHSYSKPLGLITVNLPSGKQDIAGWFENTQIRILANVITGISFLSLIVILIIKQKKNLK